MPQQPATGTRKTKQNIILYMNHIFRLFPCSSTQHMQTLRHLHESAAEMESAATQRGLAGRTRSPEVSRDVAAVVRRPGAAPRDV